MHNFRVTLILFAMFLALSQLTVAGRNAADSAEPSDGQ